jgi:hypothetical protein
MLGKDYRICITPEKIYMYIIDDEIIRNQYCVSDSYNGARTAVSHDFRASGFSIIIFNVRQVCELKNRKDESGCIFGCRPTKHFKQSQTEQKKP